MFNELIAYLTHPDGTKIQVLTQDGSALDAEATKVAYDNYSLENPFVGTIQVLTGTRNPEIVI